MKMFSEKKVQHNKFAFYSVSRTLLVSGDTIISRTGRRDEYIHGNSKMDGRRRQTSNFSKEDWAVVLET